MYDHLFVGMTIYHKTRRTKAFIASIDQNNLIIELSKEIALKKVLTLPITHIGEWLFFDEDDVDLSAEILANRPEYLKYKNGKILDAYYTIIEQKEKMEAEEARRLAELAKQKEIELQRQCKIEEEIKYEIQLKTEFIDFLKSDYQFDGFHHYTDFLNFIDIMKTGKLLSRNEAQKRNFSDAADQSVINITSSNVKNCVRFYYKEKTPTTFDNEGIKVDNSKPHMPIPVLLLFDESIIKHKDIAFTSGCGGSRYSKFAKNVQMAVDFDWKTVFSRGWIPTDEDSIINKGYDNNKANVINKRNAEFLFKQNIHIKYIKKIIFRSPADLKHAALVLGENHLFEVNLLKFNNHRNYLYDYNFVYKPNHYDVTLIFHSDHSNYLHELKIKYSDSFSEKLNITIPNKRVIIKVIPHNYMDQKRNILYFDFIPLANKRVNKIEYLMNCHISALWEVNRI